jgi:Multiubiquitin
MANENAGGKQYHIVVDSQKFDWGKRYISGAELRALAGIASGVQVFLEEPGPEKADRPVPPETTIDLDEPGIEKFYTIPPATFGR